MEPTNNPPSLREELSAGRISVSSFSCSAVVAEMEPTKNSPSFRKEYAMFLQKPIMVYGVWPLVLGYFVNHLSGWATTAGTKTSGVIPFLPYMVFSVVMCVISGVWWCLRLQRLQRLSQGIQMTQAVQSYTISVSDDATLPLESGVQGRQDASEDNTVGASTRRNPHQDLQADSSILSPSSDRQHSDQNQSSERYSCRHGPAERIGGGGHEMMNGDFSNNHLSTGSSLHGVLDLAPASSPPHAIIGRNSGTQLLSSMLLITEEEDISRLAEVLREALNNPGRCLCLVNVVNNNDVPELLVKMLQPQSNLPVGSRVLHKRIEIGQTGHWWKDFLSSEVIEYMKLAKTFDKDCTMQLGSVAVLKHTDAGLKCWMLQKDWTPVILDLHRSRRSILHLLNDERPKWTVRGFNLEKAILRVATTQRSRDLTILNYRKIDDGVEELSFQEPRIFRMFSNEVYIVALNTVQLEGVTSKLYSEARKVQGAFWISVLDSLIPILWTGLLIANLLLVGGFAFPTRNEFFTVGWLAVGFPIGYSVFLLLLREFAPLEDIDVYPNHGSTMSSEDRRNTITVTVTPSPAIRNREEEDVDVDPNHGSTISSEDRSNAITVTSPPVMRNREEEEGTASSSWNLASASWNLARQRESDEGENSKIENALRGRDGPFSNQYNCILHGAKGSPALNTLKEDGAPASLVRLVSHESNSNLKANAARALWASAAMGEEGNFKISDADGTQRGNPELQDKAAGALQSLAPGTDENKRQRMEVAWALQSLGESLLEDDNPDLQETAEGTWQSLTSGTDDIKLQIEKDDMALEYLVSSLFRNDNPGLQEYAAEALRGLTSRTDEIKLEIVKDEVALKGLVSSLFGNDNPGMQENAAGALWSLASGTDEVKLQIVRRGALIGLVRSLFQDYKPELQENAAGALQSLASGTDEIKLRIVKEDMALKGLVRSLSCYSNPGLQAMAAGALWRLARGSEEVKLNICNEDGALDGLVSALSQDDNPELQENAKGALQSLELRK